MSITAITIENFKGIKEPVRLELKPITLLFGPNSAGKSTIVQALHYASEIFDQENFSPDRTIAGGDSVDLGGFQNLVHNHDLSLPLRLRFDLSYNMIGGNKCPPVYFYKGNPELDPEAEQIHSFYHKQAKDSILKFWLEITVRWSSFLDKPFISSSKTGFGEKLFAEITDNGDGESQKLCFLDLKSPVFATEEGDSIVHLLGPLIIEDEENNILNLNVEHCTMPTGWIYCHFPQYSMKPHDATLVDKLNSFRDMLASLLSFPVRYLKQQLDVFRYIGPLRKVPRRGYTPPLTASLSRWSDGLAGWDELYKANPSFVTKVNNWFLKMKIGYSVEVKQYKEVDLASPFALAFLQDSHTDEELDLRHQYASLPVKRRLLLREANRDIEVSPADIGVGISQVLPVIVLALTYREEGIISIEQPELHIHPALQVALGDLFIEEINCDKNIDKYGGRYKRDVIDGKIFLLETHSEHLMLRFLRRIRETAEQKAPENLRLTPADLSINFIEQGENGISCVPIRVDEDGEFIDKWPHGFFGERARELF